MKYLFLFETFIEFEKERQSKKETPKNTHLIYSDDKMTIKVVKTLDSSKAISDPQWCSTTPDMFYRHNLTANMYRFTFKDGYKLRLTWDYLPLGGSGTHWGQGGIMPDGKRAYYLFIVPIDINNPFEFNYHKNDDRQYMVDKIKQIPKKAIDAVYEYQKKHSMEKSALYKIMYEEIEKIKVIGFDKKGMSGGGWLQNLYDFYYVKIKYNGKVYKLKVDLKSFNLWLVSDEFKKDFKNKYVLAEMKALNNYIFDKTIEWLKSNNKELYLKIRYNKVKDTNTKDNPF